MDRQVSGPCVKSTQGSGIKKAYYGDEIQEYDYVFIKYIRGKKKNFYQGAKSSMVFLNSDSTSHSKFKMGILLPFFRSCYTAMYTICII